MDKLLDQISDPRKRAAAKRTHKKYEKQVEITHLQNLILHGPKTDNPKPNIDTSQVIPDNYSPGDLV